MLFSCAPPNTPVARVRNLRGSGLLRANAQSHRFCESDIRVSSLRPAFPEHERTAPTSLMTFDSLNYFSSIFFTIRGVCASRLPNRLPCVAYARAFRFVDDQEGCFVPSNVQVGIDCICLRERKATCVSISGRESHFFQCLLRIVSTYNSCAKESSFLVMIRLFRRFDSFTSPSTLLYHPRGTLATYVNLAGNQQEYKDREPQLSPKTFSPGYTMSTFSAMAWTMPDLCFLTAPVASEGNKPSRKNQNWLQCSTGSALPRM